MPCELNFNCVFQGGAALHFTHYPLLFSLLPVLLCPKAPVHFFLFSSPNAPPPNSLPYFFFFICQAGFALLKISINNALLVSVALSL